MRKIARARDIQASSFDFADKVLEGSLGQPGVGVEEEDQVSLRAVASYIPATRDGRLAVENHRDGRLCSNADGLIAGAGVNDDDLIGSLTLALYVREQLT
jgi:hypothetical protein